MALRRQTLLTVLLILSMGSTVCLAMDKAIANVRHPQAKKILYFTFDDGPSERYTPQILTILGQHHVQATFFVLGERCQKYPDIVRRIRREGHEIGSHGYDHQFILHQSAAHIRREVQMADEAIYRACGTRPVYYRPPGGLAERTELITVQKLGHPVALWTVDSDDWRAKSALPILFVVKRDARPGSIVLFHDGVSGSRYTVQALPELIQYFNKKGYQFRPLPLR